MIGSGEFHVRKRRKRSDQFVGPINHRVHFSLLSLRNTPILGKKFEQVEDSLRGLLRMGLLSLARAGVSQQRLQTSYTLQVLDFEAIRQHINVFGIQAARTRPSPINMRTIIFEPHPHLPETLEFCFPFPRQLLVINSVRMTGKRCILASTRRGNIGGRHQPASIFRHKRSQRIFDV